MKIIKNILLLCLVLIFTACSSFLQKDGFYTGEKPIKETFGLVIASATADKYFGNTLLAYIRLENINTNETIDLENRICKITKNSLGMGPLAKMIIGNKPIIDEISYEKRCGSLLAAEIKSGTYILKYVRIVSVNNASGGYASSIKYTPLKEEKITIKDGQIIYIGNVYTDILEMTMGYKIYNSSIIMSDNYKYDSKIFKKKYPLLKDSLIINSSIIFERK